MPPTYAANPSPPLDGIEEEGFQEDMRVSIELLQPQPQPHGLMRSDLSAERTGMSESTFLTAADDMFEASELRIILESLPGVNPFDPRFNEFIRDEQSHAPPEWK
jgi:hypothetical protein